MLETSEGIFDINNENTPAILSANQNNYDPGNYDILRISSSLAVSITGISGGVKGRRLQLFNIGSYAITLSNLSASSIAANRFNFVNASDFLIPPNGTALLYYDSTQDYWIGGDMSSIYDVVNENTPSQITADQNDYSIGLYEVLRLSSSAAYTITGFSGGVKGRSLEIFNVGSFNITLAYQSASSIAANRLDMPSGEKVVLYPQSGIRLYYDSTISRWKIPDAVSWLGTYGLSFSASYTAAQSILNNTDTQITNWTVVADPWNIFNVAGQKIVIPFTGVYLGVFAGSFNINATGLRQLRWLVNGFGDIYQSTMAITSANLTTLSCPFASKLTAGDEVTVDATQISGGALDFNPKQWFLTRAH